MKLSLCVLILVVISSSCSKKPANPELSDPIYMDLRSELDIATKALESEQKNLIKLKEELKLVIPQTGQIKYATKKVNASEKSIDLLKQRKTYFEIKLETRKFHVEQQAEAHARDSNVPFPDKAELDSYFAVQKFHRSALAAKEKKDQQKIDAQKPKRAISVKDTEVKK